VVLPQEGKLSPVVLLQETQLRQGLHDLGLVGGGVDGLGEDLVQTGDRFQYGLPLRPGLQVQGLRPVEQALEVEGR
jgi:hypothetical protein